MKGSLVWFRRDLRLVDHAALYHAQRADGPIHCVFVFDTDILDGLSDRADRRVAFIHARIVELQAALAAHGGGLHVLHGPARHRIPELAGRLGVTEVHAARDYEPNARRRDAEVARALVAQGQSLHLHKDQVIFDTDEVMTGNARPYHVFTPYKRAWLAKLDPFYLSSYPVRAALDRLAPGPSAPMPTLSAIGFQAADPGIEPADASWQHFQEHVDHYHEARDFPAVDGTSRLSAHLRFGTLSIRELARFARERGGKGAETWLSELIWREFYQMLLWHYPDTVEQAFQKKFDTLRWPNPPGHLEAWQTGRTGYPIVDAAMRQLAQTGFMHNRLRMIAASFLVKDLHVDWRDGERWFAAKLLDYDQAANVGGWQWCASTGTDAQPWFRIFNPVTQSEKFDPNGAYIRRWLPELAALPDRYIHAPWKRPPTTPADLDYPPPIVDHARARAFTLELFKGAG